MQSLSFPSNVKKLPQKHSQIGQRSHAASLRQSPDLGLAAKLRKCYSNLREPPPAHPAPTPFSGALNSAVECHLHTVEVAGSNPAAPTRKTLQPLQRNQCRLRVWTPA